MLEQLLVELEYPFTANCSKCSKILFEIKIIDQFIRTPPEDRSIDAANFYMLQSNTIPSAITIDKNGYINKSRPFDMLFVSDLKCTNCQTKIGLKLLSVSSELPCYDLLQRLFVDAFKVRIRTKKQDVTGQVTCRFNQQWQKDLETNSFDLSDQRGLSLMVPHRSEIQNQKKGQNHQSELKKAPKNKKQQEKVKCLDNSLNRNQIRNVRKKLEEDEQNKQLIKQIISTMDFFTDILTTLQKRVAHTENVCFVLKDKVETIIPNLRKNNQKIKNTGASEIKSKISD